MQTKKPKPATRPSLNKRGRPRRHQAQGDDHPTRDALIRAALALLETLHPEEITLDKILVASGVSKGSLYHQFSELDALIDEALLLDFSRGVQADIAAIAHLTAQAQSKIELAQGLRVVTRISQDPALKHRRLRRASLILRAQRDRVFSQKLITIQNTLTQALSRLIEAGQNKRWIEQSFSPRAAATLIQAYSLGRLIGQIEGNELPPSEWNAMINTIIEQGMMGLPGGTLIDDQAS
jgi:AcrR family transcriptional regulator